MAGYQQTTQIIKDWFEQTRDLKPGQSLFIPCESKSHQNSMKTRLYAARAEYMLIDPLVAEKISFQKVVRETLPWIRAYISKLDPKVGFIKDDTDIDEATGEGRITQVSIRGSDERRKMLAMMLKDGFDLEKIKDHLGELNKDEIAMIKGGEKSKPSL